MRKNREDDRETMSRPAFVFTFPRPRVFLEQTYEMYRYPPRCRDASEGERALFEAEGRVCASEWAKPYEKQNFVQFANVKRKKKTMGKRG